MNGEHIQDWLDGRAPGEWTAEEEEKAARHAAECPDCHDAWLAARIARTLLHARTGNPFPVPVGFRARLMSAVRERPPARLIDRLWLANARLVYAIALSILILGLVTLREEMRFRAQVAAEPDIETGSLVVAYDLAMGESDNDGLSN